MRDPYAILGVAKSATAGEVKTAFRRLAKKYHPDANKNDPKAQERFAEISHAYEIIGDEAKRKQFDRGEIDAEGKETHGFGGEHSGYGNGNPFGGFRRRSSTNGSGFDAEDILKSMFGGQSTSQTDPFGGAHSRQRQARPQKGKDIELSLAVTADDIINAGKSKLKLPDGRVIAVNIPKGVENGQTIRLKGQGQAGPAGHRGDVLAKVFFKSDAGVRIEGSNLIVDVDVPLSTAVTGGKVILKTPGGKVALKVAPWSNSGTILRLRGRGLPKKTDGHGDLLAVLRITIEDADRQTLEALFISKDETVR